MYAGVVFLLCLQLCHGQILTFNLTDYDPANKTTEIHRVFINLTAGLSQIQVINIPDSVGFFIIQTHSFPYNVTLSSHRKLKPKASITGANVGLVAFKQKDTLFYLQSLEQTTALVVLIIYQPGDPIPGGCNLTFDTEDAPYQLISNTDDVIIVQSQPPSAPTTTCDKNNITVELYHLYLHENNYEPSYYFDGIDKMLTVDQIRANAHRVDSFGGYFKYRKLYSSYRGVGQVFAIVATYQNRSSAYVPAVSYGCDLADQAGSCNGPVTPHWKLICAFLLIFGGFMCFFGHRFFRSTLYMMGFAVGMFLTYVILSLSDSITVAEKTTTSLLIGLIYASVWLLVWWKFGIPILSVSLTFFTAGFLIASIVFYAGVADLAIFHNDINFWLTFSSIIIACAMTWTMFTLEGHVFGCSVLGAYACVSALNYYTGGNLQYIIINSYRRIAVKNFNMATIDPPFQIMDIAQALLWVAMTCFGFYYQMREQRGRSPFPPHRYSAVREGVSERTPLMTRGGVIYADI